MRDGPLFLRLVNQQRLRLPSVDEYCGNNSSNEEGQSFAILLMGGVVGRDSVVLLEERVEVEVYQKVRHLWRWWLL